MNAPLATERKRYVRPPAAKREVEERYYLNEDEADLVNRAAYAAGLSKSEFVRRCVLPRARRDLDEMAS